MKFVITRISGIIELANSNLGIIAMDSDGALHTLEISPEAQEIMRLPFSTKNSAVPMFRMHLENGLTLDLPASSMELRNLAIGLSTLVPWRKDG